MVYTLINPFNRRYAISQSKLKHRAVCFLFIFFLNSFPFGSSILIHYLGGNGDHKSDFLNPSPPPPPSLANLLKSHKIINSDDKITRNRAVGVLRDDATATCRMTLTKRDEEHFCLFSLFRFCFYIREKSSPSFVIGFFVS